LFATAAITVSSPIGPPPMIATVSLASMPPAASTALYATEKGSTSAPTVCDMPGGSLCSHSPRAVKYSASAPSMEKPK
jgi:hypothetical protein